MNSWSSHKAENNSCPIGQSRKAHNSWGTGAKVLPQWWGKVSPIVNVSYVPPNKA